MGWKAQALCCWVVCFLSRMLEIGGGYWEEFHTRCRKTVFHLVGTYGSIRSIRPIAFSAGDLLALSIARASHRPPLCAGNTPVTHALLALPCVHCASPPPLINQPQCAPGKPVGRGRREKDPQHLSPPKLPPYPPNHTSSTTLPLPPFATAATAAAISASPPNAACGPATPYMSKLNSSSSRLVIVVVAVEAMAIEKLGACRFGVSPCMSLWRSARPSICACEMPNSRPMCSSRPCSQARCSSGMHSTFAAMKTCQTRRKEPRASAAGEELVSVSSLEIFGGGGRGLTFSVLAGFDDAVLEVEVCVEGDAGAEVVDEALSDEVGVEEEGFDFEVGGVGRDDGAAGHDDGEGEDAGGAVVVQDVRRPDVDVGVDGAHPSLGVAQVRWHLCLVCYGPVAPMLGKR